MNSSRDFIYQDLYSKIEKLFNENRYNQIVNIKDTSTDIDFLDPQKIHYFEFAEIFAVSYTELKLFQKALVIIDNHIQYLIALGNTSSDDYSEDLTTFFLMKIKIYEKQNSILKQLKCVLNYIKIGGKDKQILDMKFDLEEASFSKYVMVNKVLLFVTFGLSLLKFFSILSIGKSFLSILIPTVLIWFTLNYFFWRKIKQFYLIGIRRYMQILKLTCYDRLWHNSQPSKTRCLRLSPMLAIFSETL